MKVDTFQGLVSKILVDNRKYLLKSFRSAIEKLYLLVFAVMDGPQELVVDGNRILSLMPIYYKLKTPFPISQTTTPLPPYALVACASFCLRVPLIV